jgi:GntR family transcriptional regulator, transcriptional repressor for pyruvate dehydrogenase complex
VTGPTAAEGLAAPAGATARAVEDVLRASVKVRSLDDVVGQLREILVSGVVRPGERLPSERALATMLSVSRATVRESLRALEALGLLDIRLGGTGGAFVRAPEPRLVGSALSTLLMFEGASEEDLTEYRIAFEQENAALAALRADDVERAQLGAMLGRARAASVGPASWAAVEGLDFELHQLLPRLTHNAVRIAIAHGIHDALRRSFDRVQPSADGTAILRDDVVRLLEAVLSRDADAARSAMVEHITSWRLDGRS